MEGARRGGPTGGLTRKTQQKEKEEETWRGGRGGRSRRGQKEKEEEERVEREQRRGRVEELRGVGKGAGRERKRGREAVVEAVVVGEEMEVSGEAAGMWPLAQPAHRTAFDCSVSQCHNFLCLW